MPTLFYYFGLRFYCFSNEQEPIHIHVSCGDKEAKFRVDPTIELIENYGLGQREIKHALMAIEENRNVIIKCWHQYFDK